MAGPNSTPTQNLPPQTKQFRTEEQTARHDVEPARVTSLIELPQPEHGAESPESGRILLDRYKVKKVIGAGGMGVVYQVRSITDGRKLALKTLHPDRRPSSDTLKRFVREAELLKKLQHPHIVELIESGELPGGTPFMVMDLLRGRDLREELRLRGPLPISEAVGYCLQVTLALDEAHRAGVVHRDIKPQNMFITSLDGARCVKLLDFGISKLADGADNSLTGTQDVLGTPSYMSPEQVLATREVDQRTDFWSLGVVLYFLLTGKLPFSRPSAAATFAAIPADSPPSPRQLAPHLPKALEVVIMKCLEKNPDKRFQSAAELGVALAPFGPIEGASVRVPHTRIPSTIPPLALPDGNRLLESLDRYQSALPEIPKAPLSPHLTLPLLSRTSTLPGEVQSAKAGQDSSRASMPVSLEPPPLKTDQKRLFTLLPTLLSLVAIVIAVKWSRSPDPAPRPPPRTPATAATIATTAEDAQEQEPKSEIKSNADISLPGKAVDTEDAAPAAAAPPPQKQKTPEVIRTKPKAPALRPKVEAEAPKTPAPPTTPVEDGAVPLHL